MIYQKVTVEPRKKSMTNWNQTKDSSKEGKCICGILSTFWTEKIAKDIH